jgi:hypothetical protein
VIKKWRWWWWWWWFVIVLGVPICTAIDRSLKSSDDKMNETVMTLN